MRVVGGKKKQKRKKLKITIGEENLKIYEMIHKGPEGFKLFFFSSSFLSQPWHPFD